MAAVTRSPVAPPHQRAGRRGSILLLLWGAGEQGFWYDPADLSTQFQDSLGTTPVTAVGQAVGLVLDKHLGLTRGPQKIVNGGFDTADLSAWTFTNCTGAVVNGQLVVTANGVGNAQASHSANAVGGTSADVYEAVYDLISASRSVNVTCVATNVIGSVGTGKKFLATRGGSTPLSFLMPGALNGETFVVDNLSVMQIFGNHLTQGTTTSRPILQVDANGFMYWSTDGTDDGMATTGNVDFSGTAQMTVWAGIMKASDVTAAALLELSSTSATTPGTFGMFAPVTAGSGNYQWRSGGTTPGGGAQSAASFPAPIFNVLTGASDIAAPSMSLYVNGALAASNSLSQGTGNFAAQPLNAFKRGNNTIPFNGRTYQLLGRGAATDAATRARVERFVGSRMGIAL